MAPLEREFHRSFRGPLPTDEDAWRLVFDPTTTRLVVRHEWRTTRHSGVEELSVEEFLAQESGARESLIALLFDQVAINA
ncbi:MAG TPA: hypothetical protein VKS78_13425 [Roseiarcus sp.]|nr:hypothetical protein [Roseiarcus sp.]